jgi:hypothetical protein
MKCLFPESETETGTHTKTQKYTHTHAICRLGVPQASTLYVQKCVSVSMSMCATVCLRSACQKNTKKSSYEMKVREKRGGLSHNQLYTRFNCSSDQILKNGVRNVNVKEQFRKDHYLQNNHSLAKTSETIQQCFTFSTVCGHLFYQQLNGLFVREQIDNIRANDARATPRIHSLKC